MSNTPFSFENSYSTDYEHNQNLSEVSVPTSLDDCIYRQPPGNPQDESRLEYPCTEQQRTQQFSTNVDQSANDQYSYWLSSKFSEIERGAVPEHEMVSSAPSNEQPLNAYHSNNTLLLPFFPMDNDDLTKDRDIGNHLPLSDTNAVVIPHVNMEEEARVSGQNIANSRAFENSTPSDFNNLLGPSLVNCDEVLGSSLNSQSLHQALPGLVPGQDGSFHNLPASNSLPLHNYRPAYVSKSDNTSNGFYVTPNAFSSSSRPKKGPLLKDTYAKYNIPADNYHQKPERSDTKPIFHGAFDHSAAVAGSSIPTDIDKSQYSAQCILAAKCSRLDPYSLCPDEYRTLYSSLGYLHVTTYLNIRNGICRLWLSNPLVYVHPNEALGCARNSRFFNLAGTAYEWLIRSGRINFGCTDAPKGLIPIECYTRRIKDSHSTNSRKTIVVIGAGLAGLACAQQLNNLFKHYSGAFTKDKDIPRVLVIEGRKRVGGRIYSIPLNKSFNKRVDVGASILSGMEFGNPLSVIVRRQLGIPVKIVNKSVKLFDEESGTFLSQKEEQRAQQLFNAFLEVTGSFRASTPPTKTVDGDSQLIDQSEDPSGQEGKPIKVLEEELEQANLHLAKINYQQQLLHESASENKLLNKIKLVKMGFEPQQNSSDADIPAIAEPTDCSHPNLAASLDGILHRTRKLVSVSSEVERALNWHAANLEAAAGSTLDSLCLANWDLDDDAELGTCQCEVVNGLSSLVKGLLLAPERLDVRANSAVKMVEYGHDGALVTLENGESISASRVICTVPLGVLKANTIQFNPPLPSWKDESIRKLGYGVINKVILVFDVPFWGDSVDAFGVCRDQSGNGFLGDTVEHVRGRLYLFNNYSVVVGKPCLVGILSGKAAEDVNKEEDNVIIEEAYGILRKMFPTREVPQAIESIVTRWQRDPFARGTFSYVGVEASAQDYDNLAKPLQDTLFFAGEATNKQHPSSIQGAYLSGIRAANEILTSLIGPITVPPLLVSAKSLDNTSERTSTRSKEKSSGTKVQGTTVKGDPNIDSDNLSKRDAFESAVLGKLGVRPEKPSKTSTNPFLIFQKDFWEKCRQQCDDQKRRATGNNEIRAGRNEVRAALGKMWRELPENEKRPYMIITSNNRAANEKRVKDFKDRLESYDRNVQQFKQLWQQQQQQQQQTLRQ